MVNKLALPAKQNDVVNKVNEIIDDYVTTDTAQDITGQKTIIGQTILKASSSASSGANTVSGFEFENSQGTLVGRMTSTETNGIAIHSTSYIQLRPFTKASGAINSYGVQVDTTGLLPTSATAAVPYDLGSSSLLWDKLYLRTAIYVGANNYAISLPTKAGTMALTSDIPTVDQTYDRNSTNAQSGVAVGSAIDNIATQLVAAINTKQDTLVSGTGIDITNDVISVDSETTSEVTLATVATSGSYNDLSNKPTIPTVNNPTITITQGGVTKGSFTLNQASGDTIVLDAGGGGGAVDSVNGYTGTVVLAPSDLGITEYTANEVETLWSSL